MDESIAISIKNLTYFYNSPDDPLPAHILKGINLEIKSRSFVAILGHNGSGKSTLAKHMNGLLLPKGGTVHVFGMDTRDEALTLNIRRSVGMVFQNPDNQIVSNMVEEDVAFAPENLGCDPIEIRHRVDESLKMVDMYKFRDHAPHLLSGGQKQRIAIAGVLAMRPKCVVFDEPTAMLDPKGRADVMNIIKKLRDEQQVTVILITHHMDEAAMADRVVVMNDGRIVMDGTPREIFPQVEKLEGYGLTVPETTRLIYELNKEGLELPLDTLSVEECAESISRYIRNA